MQYRKHFHGTAFALFLDLFKLITLYHKEFVSLNLKLQCQVGGQAVAVGFGWDINCRLSLWCPWQGISEADRKMLFGHITPRSRQSFGIVRKVPHWMVYAYVRHFIAPAAGKKWVADAKKSLSPPDVRIIEGELGGDMERSALCRSYWFTAQSLLQLFKTCRCKIVDDLGLVLYCLSECMISEAETLIDIAGIAPNQLSSTLRAWLKTSYL